MDTLEKEQLIVRVRRQSDALRASRNAEFELVDMRAQQRRSFLFTDAELRHLTADGRRQWKETQAQFERTCQAKEAEISELRRAAGCAP